MVPEVREWDEVDLERAVCARAADVNPVDQLNARQQGEPEALEADLAVVGCSDEAHAAVVVCRSVGGLVVDVEGGEEAVHAGVRVEPAVAQFGKIE